MANQSKRIKMYLDVQKHRQTSHWDVDAMSRAQLDHEYEEGRRERRRFLRRQFSWIAFWLFLLCLHPTIIYWANIWWFGRG